MNALLHVQLEASVQAGRLDDGNFTSLCDVLRRMADARTTPAKVRRAIRLALVAPQPEKDRPC